MQRNYTGLKITDAWAVGANYGQKDTSRPKNPTATSEEPGAKAGELSLHWTPPAAAAAAKVLQSCPTLCDPIDGRPPGSPMPGILQARTLEWVVIAISNA